MSIASEISRIQQNVSDSLSAVANKGVVVPAGSTSDDLPELIAQITSGSTGTKCIWTEQDGDGAWDVSGYAYCSVNGAMVDDNIERWWILVNETLGMTVKFSVTFQMANYPIVLYWGDGTSTEVRSSSNSQTITTEHTYSAPGMKVIEYSISSAGNPNYGGIASPVPLGQTSTQKDNRIIYVNFAGTASQSRKNVGCRYSNSLRKITFDSHVTSTHSTRAFNGCTALDNVVIPATLTTIANQTFYNCTGLKSVTCLSTTPPTLGGTGVFYNVPTSTLKIYVPASALDTYKSATNWSTYASCMEAIPE